MKQRYPSNRLTVTYNNNKQHNTTYRKSVGDENESQGRTKF